ncbi:MAG: MBL fold metallo-hydrolase, partial [Planctomycetota bacterium]
IDEKGVKLLYAFDTHTHADHLSGCDRLRNWYGCKVVMSDASKSKVPDTLASDGQKFPLGSGELTLIHTPGHKHFRRPARVHRRYAVHRIRRTHRLHGW